MSEPQRPGRLPHPGEIWHPADDPEDAAIITKVEGGYVHWRAPADTTRDRGVPHGHSARIDDFTCYFIPPQEMPVDGQPATPPDLNTGTRGEYNEWVIETKLGRRLGVCVDKSPYPEDARQQLETLRAEYPWLMFRAVRETTTRTEEDW